MSSASGYGSVPSEPVPEHERPEWMRPAGASGPSSQEPPTAQYGYSLDKPSAPAEPSTPYASPYPGQTGAQGQQGGSWSGYTPPQAPQQPGYTQNQPGYAQNQPGYSPAPGGYPPAGQPYPAQPHPGQPYPGQWVQEDPYAKSRVVAGLLGIFLGAFGIHRFYTGHTGIGMIMLLITVFSLGIFAAVTSIWGLIEGILYLVSKTGSYSRDASGRPLRG